MSRYLLIEFDDKDSATKLKKQIDHATKNGRNFRVIGYFAKPDGPYCDCDQDTWTYNRGKPYAGSKHIRKTGWTKCLECGNYRDNASYNNLLGVDKLIKYVKQKVIKHYKTKQPIEVISHVLNISFVNSVSAKEDDQ